MEELKIFLVSATVSGAQNNSHGNVLPDCGVVVGPNGLICPAQAPLDDSALDQHGYYCCLVMIKIMGLSSLATRREWQRAHGNSQTLSTHSRLEAGLVGIMGITPPVQPAHMSGATRSM